ncbi:MAG: glycoside hydrolase family 127 protein [Anaerolineae bacterium]|nr:glycoside hydrolase family 127 protein [Anaerolineae bacterium]
MPIDKNSLPKPVYLDKIRIPGGLWEQRQTINRSRTIPVIYEQLQKTGRLDAWRLDPDRERPKRRSVIYMFWDSDTGKWLEAVGYSLHTHPDPALEKQVDDLIDLMASAQQPDGYLNTYFANLEPENQWANLRDWHEMYNAGHLTEGAVAYYRATGKRAILDVLARFADQIAALFGPNEGQKRGYPGHPELEMALVTLYRATGDKKYLNLSKYFIDERGQDPHYFDIEASERGEDPDDFWAQTYKYCQAHKPVREQTEATGHAVRACYLYAGIADVALETQDQELVDVSRRLWDDLTSHQMYITGGLGPAHSNEGFTFAYDLPNETAYAETCAAISLAFWAHRMFHIDPHSRYIDVMERALYNNVLSGVSYEGEHFFYANPLTSYPNVNPHEHFSGITSDRHYRRSEWFFCPCCPPNLARIVASIGGYFYSTTADRLYVHLYNQSSADFEFGGQAVQLEQQTNYPWDGRIQFTVKTDTPAQFELALRIPGWCRRYTLEVNGQPQSITPQNGYAVIARQWQDSDRVTLVLDMPVERMSSHPDIRQDAGQIALQRGPVVYCLEEVDNGARLANVAILRDGQLHVEFDADLFGGISVITGEAVRIEPASWPGGMYQPQSVVEHTQSPFQFKAIPYYLWANRDPGEMRTWIRRI